MWEYLNLKKIPTKYDTYIINETKNFLKEIFDLFEKEIVSIVDNDNINKLNMNRLISEFLNCLNIIEIEQKRFSLLKTLKSYIDPVSYKIGGRVEYRKVNLVETLVYVPVNAQFIPLRIVLNKFFELPTVLDDTIRYMQDLVSNNAIITNIV